MSEQSEMRFGGVVDHVAVQSEDLPRDVQEYERLGFRLVREHEHIAMVRQNADGTRTPLTLPNHSHIKGSTLRTICTQSGITREDFLLAYSEA